jgi:hypothetical protein
MHLALKQFELSDLFVFRKCCSEMSLYLVFFFFLFCFSGCAKAFVVAIFQCFWLAYASQSECLLYFQSLYMESTLSTLALRIHVTYGLALAD